MKKIADTIENATNGKPLQGASVSLTIGDIAQPLYLTNDTSGASVTSVTTDEDGYYEFYAPDGVYSLVASYGEVSKTVEDFEVYDLSELKALADSAVTRNDLGDVGIGATSPAYRLDVSYGLPNVARIRNPIAASYAELQVASDDRALLIGQRSSTHPDGELCYLFQPNFLAITFFTNAAERLRVQADGHTRPGADNSYTLGSSSFRWTTVYATTGSINTSDEREKSWRGKANAAELRAARRIIDELGFFQWNDAIEAKGTDGARYHFGTRAQRAFKIMEDEGLDWRRYAWCCHDKLENGEDGYGVRPDQLALFLIAAVAS